ncbi:hypothetical protein QBC34DRAFT_310689 [Podospora aff. communis PSN243]|uniref:Glycoside hydrolase family 125 protein n=1 Tax=Podospora aff. communis PSN243 TaxID=3040156 RepID=A0AAV9G5Z3_9PEZI|nr:hypothetical protein QBC34DRAFT_310689 [Podospora aff. communis PSN243]
MVIADEEFSCPDYSTHSLGHNKPISKGRYQLPYQRPIPACRTLNLTEVEDTILSMKETIRDPDLFRLFENCFPNTLDTAITWKGTAKGKSSHKNEELTFITTGDIPAMWLRDSANQLQSYLSLLRPSSSPRSLASLFRGAINLQSRYILSAPHCNAFHPPEEANLTTPTLSFSPSSDAVSPSPPSSVFECKYELDSLAAFLQLSHDYHSATSDTSFFSSQKWITTIETILNTTTALLAGSYTPSGHPARPVYTFQRTTSSSYETLPNTGIGSPVKAGTGMVRSAFRPSDDACTYQLFVPGNMMFSRYLGLCAGIMERVGRGETARRMREMARGIREGVERFGKVWHRRWGRIYAYEVDGFGGAGVMDDANIPSLLSAPLSGYLDRNDPIYQNTRRFVLSEDNPYYMFGAVINGTGGPHVGPGMAWPMSLIVRILTSDNDAEIVSSLKQILSSTNKLGLIHESVNSHDASIWTRQWFSWANGLFGQMILDLKDRKPHLLTLSYQ